MFTEQKNKEWFKDSFSHFRVPADLFQPHYATLSAEAKILYSVLLSRLALSPTRKWTDGDTYYTILTNQEACRLLNISHSTATKIFAELENTGLLIRKFQYSAASHLIPLPFKRAKD